VDVAPFRLDDDLVRVLVGEREAAIATVAAAADVTQERRRERAGAERLPSALGTGEQVRMVRTFGRPAEEGDRPLLSGDAV
jgi:hypothetical protein